MRLFKGDKVYDFMAVRWYWIGLSLVLTFGSLALIFGGKPKLGTDFLGGTEVELAFKKPVEAGAIRKAVEDTGFSTPTVIKVEDASNPNRFMVRVHEVSTIAHEKQVEIEKRLCFESADPACSDAHKPTEVKFSPGGDKITLRFRDAPDLAFVKERISAVKGIALRPGDNNPLLQNERENKVEIQLMSKGDQLMTGLRKSLGVDAVPDQALRTEWIGPRAGAQLRDAALKSIAISIVLIMAYIAFRFDLRFAPGCVVALIHDAVGTIGIFVLLGKEINLTTVAAALTIVGYSVNDTVIVYDRVRENLGKLRGASFIRLINVSTSEMLGRTILTASTVLFSLQGLFIWGTGELKDFALALTIGVVLGMYSSIYVALPLTEWFETRFFAKVGSNKKKKRPPTTRNVAPAV
ncbi:MAG TPA: protein translocase subunit SecF [Polyangiaceae bacterium]|nr:protein translocase subunit SecF [Polyangiaceae bacterium]